jgi:hypothetical protein
LTIGGIALSIGSTVANTVAQNKVAKARDQALAAERIRQNGLDQEAQALNVQSQDRYTGFDDKQAEKSKELGDYFAGQHIDASDANAAATAETVMPQSSSGVVVQEEANQRGKARDFTNKQGAALGQLRSFGDLMGDIGRDQARDATTVGQIGGFKKGSSSIVPYELEAANEAGNGMKMLGDVLGLGGGIATSAGLGGGSLGGIFTSKAAPAAAAASTDAWSGLRAVTPKSGGTSLYNLYGR